MGRKGQKYHKYDDYDILENTQYFLDTDKSLEDIEKDLDVPHSTLSYHIHTRLERLDADLYERAIKLLDTHAKDIYRKNPYGWRTNTNYKRGKKSDRSEEFTANT